MRYFVLIMMAALFCSCSMLRHDIKYRGQKEIKEYLSSVEGKSIVSGYSKEYFEKHYGAYAERYHTKTMENYRKKLTWGIGIVGSTLGLVATMGGLILLNRKLRDKK